MVYTVGMTTYGYCHCGCGEPTGLADRTSDKLGWTKGEPKKFLNGHNRRHGSEDYVEEDRGHSTPCWVWQRWVAAKGHGMKYDPRTKTKRQAHLVYYEQAVGEVPAGFELDHLCEQYTCVNPQHLQPVTHAENVRRGKAATLNWGLVREIRSLPEPPKPGYGKGKRYEGIAARYGVDESTIRNIRSNKTWKEDLQS